MKTTRVAAARAVAVATLVTAVAATALAGPYDPPPGYYSSATGTGATLQQQLHDIIDAHTVISYNNARIALQDTDMDPNDADSIILAYSLASLDVSGLMASGISGWDSGVSWNREHTWPRSRGIDSSGPDNSDLHNLRPCDPGVNGSRGNLNFGGAFGGSFGSTSDGGTKWHPGADAGQIARQMFYMETRYDGSDSSTTNLQLVAGNPGTSGSQLGDLDRLLEYHYAAPPNNFELRRNDVIHDFWQGNRNPFVDHPEFVWSIFAGGSNNSQISLGSPASDGSSTLLVDLGQVQVNDPAPAAQMVTLFKTGSDPTYYEVTAVGDATSSITGRLNAFRQSPQSVSLLVGLDASTATPGVYSDTIVIDNLDIDGAGTGTGSLDGDDVITVMFEVLADSIFPFDDNGDGLITNGEFATFAACMTGPDGGAGGACDNHDADSDLDVDLADFTTFQTLFTGP